MTEITNIRLSLLGEDNSTFLPDAVVQLALDDASILQNSTDLYAIRFYACYLLSWRWGSLQFTTNYEGISYAKPDPLVYIKQYNDRINKLSTSTQPAGFSKVSTDPNFVYDSTTRCLRRRVGSDDSD